MANLTDGDQSFCGTTGGQQQSGGTGTAANSTGPVGTSTPTAPIVSPGTTTGVGGPSSIGGGGGAVSSSAGSGGVWAEFCERHARAASADFAKSCVHYVTNNLPESARQTVSHRDFLRRFVDCFSEHFEHDFHRRRMQCKTGNGTAMVLEESDYSEDTDSPKTNHKPFFRRLSFKGLRKGKALFHKQHSDEVELSGSRSSKTKLAKIVVECRKEGTVNYLTPESLDQTSNTHKWEKCKLVLVKTVGGYMLEFYSPPKSQKPGERNQITTHIFPKRIFSERLWKVKVFGERLSTARKPVSGGNRKPEAAETTKRVAGSFKRNPNLSLRDAANKLGVSSTTVHRAKKRAGLSTDKKVVTPNRDDK
ncbi:SH2B adapter protein 2-like isoform X2 [Uranotaenia lowii]|uniref:SH2B adapter protein 2-like isoform X2 n=1 Tax=Uranotaenia lowii TaxID=190385 RepID=UPI00247A4DEC|nr:SH2B adapter protein 2-like isoform X2 [Uranotaenia lowii]